MLFVCPIGGVVPLFSHADNLSGLGSDQCCGFTNISAKTPLFTIYLDLWGQHAGN